MPGKRMFVHDYRRVGFYMITMVAADRRPLFGTCHDDRVFLSSAGETVERRWGEIPLHRPEIEASTLQVMPNHLHGIVYVKEPLAKPVGNTIRGFASGVTSELRRCTGNPALKVWEKGYPKEPINVIRDWNPTAYDTPERAGRTLFFFTAERPTTYMLRANYTDGEGPDLVLAVGALSSGYFTTALMLGLGCAALGFMLIVWNVLQRNRARKIAAALSDSD